MFLGAAAYETNQADAARLHFSATIARRDHAHNVPVREARLGLAQTSFVMGNAELARAIVASGIEDAERTQAVPDLIVYGSFQARLLLERGRIDEALAQVRTLPDELPAFFPWGFESPAYTRSQVLLAQGDDPNIESAGKELERLAAWYEDRHELWWLTRVRALQALVLRARRVWRQKHLTLWPAHLPWGSPAG